jgi:GntR family transcriptional regulator
MNSTISEAAIEISLNPANGVPVYRQIIQQIEYAVLAGRLKAGDKLPTIRSLAVTLKINPNTIVKAYSELEIRGIVVTQAGSGTYISEKKPDAEDGGRERKVNEVLGHFLKEMKDLGVVRGQLVKLIREAVINETQN